MGLFTSRSTRIVVGVISDTHGPLREDAVVALGGVDQIVCVGDSMSAEVLPALRRIARSVTAVRGNMDQLEPLRSLPATAVVRVGGATLFVLHDLGGLDLDPRAAGFAAVIHGHTHRADIDWRDGVLYLNPGSAGEPRSHRPSTIGRLTVGDGELVPEIVELP